MPDLELLSVRLRWSLSLLMHCKQVQWEYSCSTGFLLHCLNAQIIYITQYICRLYINPPTVLLLRKSPWPPIDLVCRVSISTSCSRPNIFVIRLGMRNAF